MIKTRREIWNQITELEEENPHNYLKGIVQNEHEISIDEFEEWSKSLHNYITQLEEKFDYLKQLALTTEKDVYQIVMAQRIEKLKQEDK